MRGKHCDAVSCVDSHRITPAGAGKTQSLHRTTCTASDHPRRCGENAFWRVFYLFRAGSPPQVRGKPVAKMSSFTSTRITPAGAGKTISAACRTREPWDHPRRCGENIVREPFYWYIVGSPPAYAGKTVLKHISCFLLRDHPRGCGENFRPARTARIRRGSPPRMRGKRGRRNEHIVTDMDHPRGCGENLVSPEQILHNIGSPPRMRGKHSVRVLLQQRVGITPADAGKTPLARASAICQEDHPRGCGENPSKHLCFL